MNVSQAEYSNTNAEINDILETYDYFEKYLSRQKYIYGAKISSADMTAMDTISNWSAIVPIDKKRYPKISAWVKRCEKYWVNYKEYLTMLQQEKDKTGFGYTIGQWISKLIKTI